MLAALLVAAPALPLVELNPHLAAVYARNDGADTREFIEVAQWLDPVGPLVLLVDGQGVLRTVWDFSNDTPLGFTFVAGGPGVPGRHGDLASGVGLPAGTTEDFLPDATFTLYAFRATPTLTAQALALVGTDVDPDGDGRTSFAASLTGDFARFTMAFVDATWPQASTVYDCAPIVGPDGDTIPAGAVRNGANLPPCRDLFLAADGTGVTPGTSSLPCGLTGDLDQIRCGEALLGTRFCGAGGFTRRTHVWGSPLLSDGVLNVGTDSVDGGLHVQLVSLGRSARALPGIPEPLCLATPWFRLPTASGSPYTLRYEIDLTATAQLLPVAAGVPLCIQAWYQENVGGTWIGHLAQPVAVTLR